MTRNPISNLITLFIVWVPILAVAAAVVWIFCFGAMHFEMITNGSQVFVSNQETTNAPAWRSDANSSGVQAGKLEDALASGDANQMATALGEYNNSVGG